MSECVACGEELHDDNHEVSCACGEDFCQSCIEFHLDECNEAVAANNDVWGATTRARNF